MQAIIPPRSLTGNDYFDSLMEVSFLASRSLNLDEVLPKTLAGIAELIPADRIVLLCCDDRGVEARGHWSRSSAQTRVDWSRLQMLRWSTAARETRYCIFDRAGQMADSVPYLGAASRVEALLVPLEHEGLAMGRLDIIRAGGQWPFSGSEQKLAQACARILALAVRNALEYARVAWLAEHDPLTGIGNRRRFDAAMVRELARAERYGRNLSLLLIDLDDFKEVNTRLGLSGGDEILRRTAKTLASGARKGVDVPCRIGGDEFAMVLPEIDESAAGELAQRLLNEVVRATTSLWPMRFSYSISTYPNIAGDLLRRAADTGLLDAKSRKERPCWPALVQ